MKVGWEEVPLWMLLKKSDESVKLQPEQIYKEVTIRIKGKGIVLRREARGSEMAAERRSVVRTGQFILSKIDARNGAFDLVPSSLEGAVVSNDFPTFTINIERLEPRFLEWLSKTASFVELCKAASEGTTNRVRLAESRFLQMTIAVPPLEEQKRIVARVESLMAKVDEARVLRSEAKTLVDTLWYVRLFDAFELEALKFNASVRVFGNFCDVVRGGSPRPAGDPTLYDGNIPFLKVGDLTRDESIYLDTFTFSIKEAGLSNTRLVPAGTLMLTNSGATLGVPKICNFQTTFNDGIQAFLNIENGIEPVYLYFFLLDLFHKSALRSSSRL